mgnify:CR=1 FL=1
MNNKKVAEFGIAAIGLVGIGVWTYNRLIKKHKQLLVTLAAINKMQGNAEEAVPSQVPLSDGGERDAPQGNRHHVWRIIGNRGPSSGGCQQKAGRQNHEVSGLSDSSDGRCGN